MRGPQHRHAGLDRRRARTQPLARFTPDPAVLAGAHQAEARACAVAELAVAHAPAVRQQRDEQRVTGQRGHARAVDAQGNRRAVALGKADEAMGGHDGFEQGHA
jgi:hypothetical protein